MRGSLAPASCFPHKKSPGHSPAGVFLNPVCRAGCPHPASMPHVRLPVLRRGGALLRPPLQGSMLSIGPRLAVANSHPMPLFQQPPAIRTPCLPGHPRTMFSHVHFPLLRTGKPRQRRRTRYKPLAGDTVPGVAQKERALYIRCLSVFHTLTKKERRQPWGYCRLPTKRGKKSHRPRRDRASVLYANRAR